jgi:hypothetical protein
MDGVELGARFSLATSRLRYCGPDGADRLLERAIREPAARPAARAALAQFEALMPYLETIARAHGRDPFDEAVVEAYWIGNDLLDGLGRPEFRTLIDALQRRGLPRSLADRLRTHLPREPLLHHLFHVAFVGVGNVTGHVATTVAHMESCRPAWGTVTRIGSEELELRAAALRRDGPCLAWGPERPVRLPFEAALLPDLRPGATVAYHWGRPALELSEEAAQRLGDYSARALAAANEVLPALGVLEDGTATEPASGT